MTLRKMIFMVLALSLTLFASGVPMQNMTPPITLDIEYTGLVTGQTITKASVQSLFTAHYFMLKYAPIPYLLISTGLGGTTFSTEEYDSASFDGDAGISVTLGVHCFTPRFLQVLMGTAGADVYLLNSGYEDYHYTAALLNPTLGLRFLLGNIVDIEAGIKGHILTGTMESPDADDSRFSNENYARGYLAVTLHSNRSGAYATASFDISPKASSNWSNGPDEVSLSLQIGLMIKQRSEKININKKENRSYKDMRDKQDKMAEELEGKE